MCGSFMISGCGVRYRCEVTLAVPRKVGTVQGNGGLHTQSDTSQKPLQTQVAGSAVKSHPSKGVLVL